MSMRSAAVIVGGRLRAKSSPASPTTQVKGALAPGGRCFMIAIEQNDVPELQAAFAAEGLACTVVLRRAADEESLYVLKCMHRSIEA